MSRRCRLQGASSVLRRDMTAGFLVNSSQRDPAVLVTGTAHRLPAKRVASPPGNALALRVGELWRFFRTQNLAYGAMCFYLVVEYVRPQQLISAL